MKTINIVLVWIMFLCTIHIANGQDFSDNITLHVFVPDQNSEYFSDRAKQRLENKMQRISSRYGVGGANYYARYVLIPRVDVVSFEATATAPVRMVAKVEIGMHIMENETQRQFSQHFVKSAGVGRTEQEAYYKAISNMSTDSWEIEKFITNGKNKILDYYQSKCSQLVEQAERLILMREYEGAIALLMSVPEEANSCYSRAQNLAIDAYAPYLENSCQELVLQAQLAAANRQYAQALSYLGHIKTTTICSQDLDDIIAEISYKVDANDQREWELMLRKLDNEAQLNQLKIEAIREIAIAKYQSNMQSVNFFMVRN